MDWREKRIQQVYGGDEKRYEKAFAVGVQEARMNAMNWEDLLLGVTAFPEVEVRCEDLIEARLGYVPSAAALAKYAPYLRAIIVSHDQGNISDYDFYQQADDQIKLIRNEDLEHNTCLEYNEDIYQNYQETFAAYGQEAKERLTRFLGYEPKLEHSLVAQMWLRKVMADDTFQLPSYITACDYKAITLVKYREVLLAEGKDTADMSPLPRNVPFTV
ncbi:hypothetical protein [Dyadobacter bucti]|uniref:hypothetical protein n=1 Tax=Dyadobacter bucti TaxID=2572203 RepID=UPI001107B726|nr:hypothetical protein [Dyadobacter bucti]